ncbi:MAG: metallopeptidase family protein [Anaerolineae bacterium]|nr:metallopeptidase family protein [Anaerolineae bacterium]MCO5187803.1 metallopeptidase family protein [Anaerolineae bacterium]MCO5191900.1 metallopeptidase family protein [Anaerolineae bacterium]MCO5197718.1 metallopeptidase family protein [Anaerolineae bacterium]MCO5206643.1 metallopeptidase family protein [Anaerolineae bacterium]
MMDSAEFEDLVYEALETIPDELRVYIDNVHILTRMWPSRYDLQSAGVPPGNTLLGLYSGVPLTVRTSSYNLAPPDTITLYQGPIEAEAGPDPDAIRALVRHVTIHEFAHHFGISDERLHELGAY